MLKKKKILALIDGFNYYHALNKYQSEKNVCVKWLNYKKLVTSMFKEEDDKENFNLIYFSALATHRKDGAVSRHQIYISALEKTGVKVILGHFQPKDKPKCWYCRKNNLECKPTINYEEKRTDVNIAITLLEYAYENKFDKCFLLSEDNDFVPAIEKVKEKFPLKKIIICPPPKFGSKKKRSYRINELKKANKAHIYYLTFNKIQNNQFPDNFEGLINPWQVKKEKLVVDKLETGEKVKISLPIEKKFKAELLKESKRQIDPTLKRDN